MTVYCLCLGHSVQSECSASGTKGFLVFLTEDPQR